MTHTPGPWTWGDNFRGLYGSGQDNEILCHEPYEGMWLNFSKSMEANARLIAAAPDLLAALELVAQHERIDDSEHRMNVVSAAIIKARGIKP